MMSQGIYKYKRARSQSYAAYAEHFRGIAQAYLNHCHSGSDSQDSQNFAMILLENANLPASTYNNIVSILVGGAKNVDDGPTKSFKMNEKTFSAIKSNASAARYIIIALTAPTACESIDPANFQALRQHITDQTTLLNAINNRSELENGGERMAFTISLDRQSMR